MNLILRMLELLGHIETWSVTQRKLEFPSRMKSMKFVHEVGITRRQSKIPFASAEQTRFPKFEKQFRFKKFTTCTLRINKADVSYHVQGLCSVRRTVVNPSYRFGESIGYVTLRPKAPVRL